MGYLITQIIICLIIAAVIGFIIGWLLRGLGCEGQNEAAFEGAGSEGSSSVNNFSSAGAVAGGEIAEPVTKAPVISHQIEKIEGIGKSIGNFLRSIGIKTTTDLLDKCSTDSGFQQVVKVSEVVEPVVKQWVIRADLMRVPDVDGQYAELMEVSGIVSVQDLANADAEELTEKMRTVNQREHCIPASIPLPDVNQVRHWIKDSNTLPSYKSA